MKMNSKNAERTKLNILFQKFSNAFAQYQRLLQRQMNAGDREYEPGDTSGGLTMGWIFTSLFVVLITIILFSDHYFALEFAQALMYGLDTATIEQAAWAIAGVLSAFSVALVWYHQKLKQEDQESPGVVSPITLMLAGFGKFLVPIGFYGFVLSTKISMVWNLPGVDDLFRFNQVTALLGMLVIGVLSHLCLIVAGPVLMPPVIPTITGTWDALMSWRKRSAIHEMRTKVLVQKQTVDTALRNFMMGYQRALEKYPEEQEYFRFTFSREEREYAQRAFFNTQAEK